MSNRLANEPSAYLRQHAENPVDWYPWGDEALEKARREDKPIFLSIGYAACHWCHVMEKESFEDPATALLLSTGFVAVKVDREERPDLDQVYQTVVQLMGRSGGWPLSVFLTPDQRPFYAGTYFPPERRHGLPSFREILTAVRDAYDKQRDDVLLQAGEVTESISRAMRAARDEGDASPGPDLLAKAAARLGARFDDEHGGFGSAPKFPSTMSLDVLLRHAVVHQDPTSESRVRRALWAMHTGGLWDQLGGGFHRYSTDEKWLVPHFEKMLYDNALLLGLYLDAHRALGGHDEVVRGIVAWLFREMRSPEGAFYATLDADSDGGEGRFFVWSPAEVDAAVDDGLARDVAKAHYGVTDRGNFEDTGKTVLAQAVPLDRIALRLGLQPSRVEAALETAKKAMLEAREKRPRPARDDKRLASWNGLLLGPLAEAGAVLGEPAWIDAARAAFADLAKHLERDGRVGRFVMGDAVRDRGFLDDHAALGNAAFTLWEVTGDPSYQAAAARIADVIVARFWDDAASDFHLAPNDGESLIARTPDPYDQATPSGASLASTLFLRLGALGGERGGRLAGLASRYLVAMAGGAQKTPFAFSHTVCALDRLVRGSVDVVVVGAPDDDRTRALVAAVLGRLVPNRTLVRVDPSRPETREAAGDLGRDKVETAGPTAYVCRGQTCSPPVHTPDALLALL